MNVITLLVFFSIQSVSSQNLVTPPSATSRTDAQAEQRSVTSQPAEDDQRPRVAETIVVSGIRAGETTPVTKTDVEREEIERADHGQDIPLLLRDTPSVTAYAESGVGGSGYSYLSLRGVSATRINFTLDGVPLADSEDFGTYFADFPDLAHSLQSIQIQRGVGTSTFGSPSFGGSVNMESIDLAEKPELDARLAAGSFGHRFATAGYQSGLLPGGVSLYTRLSFNTSDGFREHSGIDQRNLFVSAAKQFASSRLRFTGFSGHEKQQMSFYATDAETLRTDLRNNPLAPSDRDSFGYDLANLQFLRALSGSTNMTASAYYQRGYGWYRLDEKRYGLDGMLLGTLATMSWTRGAWQANYGVHVNRFRREHTRDADYRNAGTKNEANVFAKLTHTSGRLLTYADAQVRRTDFHYDGRVAIPSIAWTFFNPKVGARYALSGASSLYASAGVASREPTRNDLFQGEDDASFPHDLRAVRPERLLDLEAGWDYSRAGATLGINVYAMEFHDEIAATGELSEIGLALRRNVARSHRRGIELEAEWQATPLVRFRTAANLSHNRIARWTQFYDVYDAGGNYLTSEPRVHRNVEPLLTPPLTVSQSIDLPHLSVTGRYVARSYLDNTENDEMTTPAFVVLDANAGFDVRPGARLSLQVNNITNRRRLYASGYSYQYFVEGMGGARSLAAVPYYYPQATRNFVLMLDVKR
jgi:iron complex outermembrane receptor protein